MSVSLITKALFFILFGEILFTVWTEWLNHFHSRKGLPEEINGLCSSEHFERSKKYHSDAALLAIAKKTTQNLFFIALISLGSFGAWDTFLKQTVPGTSFRGALFLGSLGLFFSLVQIPFSLASTFWLEEKYGFNRTTINTFCLDFLKSLFLGMLLGLPALFSIIWFFNAMGSMAWIYAWGFTFLFQILIGFIAPILLLPLFYKLTPLVDGDLSQAIRAYADKNGFQFKGIYTMDGSKRSSKANAFFTGFGPSKRIVLFDTLIQKHTQDELVAILAHEMGHFKLHHILKQLAASFFTSAILFYLIGFFISNPDLSLAFGLEEPSIYGGLAAFSILFGPVSMTMGFISSYFSRRFEYQADRFSATTLGTSLPMISGLKKLSIDSLSNLNPHPIVVALEYSHPTLVQRLRALNSIH
jgi:STE24 endopeptidase